MDAREIERLKEEVKTETEGTKECRASNPVPGDYSAKALAKYIDHTLLKPWASREDIRKLCDAARENGFASVCVNPSYVRFVSEYLAGTDVTSCCVVGFPLGANTSEVKAFEAWDAVKNGAREVDMVLNVGAVKSGDWRLAKDDIAAVTASVSGKALVKVIIETGLLTDEEKVKACEIAKLAGADFVKTCTGFTDGKATPEDVSLMRETVGNDMGVKASSGIKTYEDAVALIKAGATRLGTSSGVAIISGAER